MENKQKIMRILECAVLMLDEVAEFELLTKYKFGYYEIQEAKKIVHIKV